MKAWGRLLALLALIFVVLTPLVTVGWQGERLMFRGEPVDLGSNGDRVGELIADVGYRSIEGSEGRISELVGENGLVVVVRDIGCPLSKKYGPRLARFEKEYRERGFGFLYINPNHQDSRDEMLDEVGWYGFEAPYASDHDAVISRALEAQMSTEVFVLDAARTLVYRGAVDDQYGIGFTKPEPRQNFLREALDAVILDRDVDVSATMAPGCYLSIEDTSASEPEVTYHNRVSRIVQNKCGRCHRLGGVGPMTLTSYDDVVGRRSMIQWVLTDRIMPPWYADDGSGPWANDFGLTEEERADFLSWIESGYPEGDPADAPLPKDWVEGWTIGEPDYVVKIPEPITVPAEGVVDYVYVYAQTDLPEDKWIREMEIRPTASDVTHHALVFVETPEVLEKIRARRREVENVREDEEYWRLRRQFQDGVRGYFASTVPGQEGIIFPDGTGKKLPAGAWLKFQLHYTPNGLEAIDQTEIGFVFADEPVHTEVQTTSAIESEFVIPAGHPDYEVSAEYEFKQPAALLSLFPHTHLRGTRFVYEVVYPDGRVETLLPVTRYDFNWQLNYLFQTPFRVPAGTKIRATAWYDNSANNPANPDSTVDVEFGEQTFDEMMIGYISWVPVDGQ